MRFDRRLPSGVFEICKQQLSHGMRCRRHVTRRWGGGTARFSLSVFWGGERLVENGGPPPILGDIMQEFQLVGIDLKEDTAVAVAPRVDFPWPILCDW